MHRRLRRVWFTCLALLSATVQVVAAQDVGRVTVEEHRKDKGAGATDRSEGS